MLESLERLDQELFVYLNSQHSPFWDTIMIYASDKYIWIPFYLLLIAYIVYRYRKQSIPMLLLAIAAVGLADFIASGVFKPFFARLRPCHNPDLSAMVNIVQGCGGQFGFMSSHASTGFALAVFFNLILSDRYLYFKIVLVTWAVIVSYSRIYLGVHYPGDTIAGALLGAFLAYLCSLAYKIVLKKNSSFIQ
ncbi:phosphatase PAP2 family protein [Pontibacter silvestris]|uniref:Phosphatase PAP2 family protein n=1 Tax=Pontibacter silvestris TaxID=2305183 RepID=A0ABW4WXX3_9BACT|nr:phosphatase PAP2 family protein [Pontibacter silvestris]MCC9135405.1 phosphatase PAP2 family protein [Pontibacter silvestris]